MTRARDLSRLSNPAVFSVGGNNNVGVNSTAPVSKLNVVGVVSATSYFGDGSNLEGVASAGLGTAISDIPPGDVIYYTNTVLSIGATVTVDPPATTNIAYTQYAEVAVEQDHDLIVADGDDFVPDILGLSSEGTGLLPGAGGRVRADNFTNKAGNGAPNFPSGLTATTGSFTGDVSISGVSTVTSLNATTGSFSGNVSIGGTLTYEDVINVDSIGIITARSGLQVLSGLSIMSGGLVEKYENAGTTLGAQPNNPISDGNVILFTGNESGSLTINFTGVHTSIASGQNVSFTVILTPNSSGVIATVQIDGVSQTIQWSGGSAPSAGTSGRDVYVFTILKTGTGTSDYVVLGSASNFA